MTNNLQHIEKCPLCGYSQFVHIETCKDYFVSHEIFSLYRCCRCHFVFTQDVPIGEDKKRYYEASDYISHSDIKKGFLNHVYHQVRRIMLRRKTRLAIKGQKTGNLLDIGCGTGYFAASVKRKGWNVVGVEQSATAAEIARNKFGIEVISPDKLPELSHHQFDTITLWHVLEHLENLNETMTLLSKLLREKGKLLIALPNNNSYDASKYRAYWAAYDVPRHIWHFSPDTFQLLAKKHDFITTTTKRLPFDAFYISILSEKYMKRKFPLLRGFISGIMGYVVSLFDKKKSSSVVYILKKPED
jgi:2-polyprenyl-3-methyl-5-hydroxy-6-metoxy-1,4-benzoquinol methylase